MDAPMRLIPSPADAVGAAANLFDATVRGGIADTRRMPSALIDEGPLRQVHRYLPLSLGGRRSASLPVLLVPPLAAPALCFDLRRGCSLAEHLLRAGARPTLSITAGCGSATARSGSSTGSRT